MIFFEITICGQRNQPQTTTAARVFCLRRWCSALLAGWAVCSLAGLAGTAAAQPVQVTDGRGVLIRLAQPARRIITLAPHLTELVYAAGADGRLAGVARYSDYPAPARQLPVVSDAGWFDRERMLALRPDLVLAWKTGTPPEVIARLEGIGLQVYVMEVARLADIARGIATIATLAGTLPESAPARTALAEGLRALQSRRMTGPPLRVFYEIWPRPLLTVNKDHLISEVLSLCGGINVFGAERMLTPEVSREALLAARPEVVLGGGSADTAATFAARWAAQPPPLNAIPAFHVAPDLIQRPTPRVLDGARAICAALDGMRARSGR